MSPIQPPSISSATNERQSTISPLPKGKSHNLKTGDAALAILDENTIYRQITPEEDARVLRKIDLWLLPVILLVYFLQQLDKSSLSYTSVFGIIQETGLVGSQYSWLTSIVYVAQLIWQPVSSYLIVRLPVAKYLFVHVFLWGAVVACTAAATNFKGLITARFFLGIFEATVAPSFITITQMRTDYATVIVDGHERGHGNGKRFRLSLILRSFDFIAIQFGSLLAYGLGHIRGSLRPYQTIFLFIGLLTVFCSPVILLVLPDSPTKAKFLNHDEKIIALERLRANNQGTETKVWKWEHLWDALIDPKTYLWSLLVFACALPSGGISAFGPLIIQGFGFDQFKTILFNIPFSAFQVIITILSALISTKIKLKWPVIFGLALPPIGGASALLVLKRDASIKNQLLGCYYVLSFYTGLQPMLYVWSSQNTAGHTKKICTTGIIFVAQCAGNIVGPQLYRTEDKPYYYRGLISNLICWIALAVLTLITAAYLAFQNRRHAAMRVRLGKEANILDTSLEEHVNGVDRNVEARNDQAFDDLTDSQNEDFIFVL